MTLSELNNLSDEEVRALAAERMGWYVEKTVGYLLNGVYCHDMGRSPGADPKGPLERLPRYPTSLDSAITLCDKMREEGWHCNLDRGAAKDDLWECAFIQMEQEAPIWYPATSASLPRAITLAFLMAKLNGN